MFTGIIQKLGDVTDAKTADRAVHYSIRTGFAPDSLELGESIAVNGVCLTVAAKSKGIASFFVSSETLARTNLGALKIGSVVNLERALTASTRLSGHIVQGHVDGLAKLATIRNIGDNRELEFELPENLARYCVEKGSITVNGISLTINTVVTKGSHVTLGIMIIPHTWEATQLKTLALGDSVNIEVDVIAKYVEKLCQPYHKH